METFYEFDGEESPPSLLEFLPAGVLFEIFKHLDWQDLCQISQTCTRFHEICKTATLWHQMRTLDFRHCAVPAAEKILGMLRRTPRAEVIIFGDVITESPNTHEDVMEVIENIKGSDKFMHKALQLCPKLLSISLHMHEITDRTVEAIAAKCVALQEIKLVENPHVHISAVKDLVSNCSSLKKLHVDSCQNLDCIAIQHTDNSQSLNLTHISLIGQQMLAENVLMLLKTCPQLVYLNLSSSQVLETFPAAEVPLGRKNALDQLQHLILSACQDLTVLSIPYCPNLELVDVNLCGKLTEISVNSVKLHTLTVGSPDSLREVKLPACQLKAAKFSSHSSMNVLEIHNHCDLPILDISYCTKLTLEQLQPILHQEHLVKELNLVGCKGIPPEELNECLKELHGLEALSYGGYSWTNVELSSRTLKYLKFGECVNTSCLPLNMPSLRKLHLYDCRDILEQEFIDGLLYGRKVVRFTGLGTLTEIQEQEIPFKDGIGVPELESLTLHDISGLYGDFLSHHLGIFPKLTVITITKCRFLKDLRAISLTSLCQLRLESCPALTDLTVSDCSSLQTLDVKWCGMVKQCMVSADALKMVDFTGTSFYHFSIMSKTLVTLHLKGVCTMTDHTLHIRCPSLHTLSIDKCDRLTDEAFSKIIQISPKLSSLTIQSNLSLCYLVLPVGIEKCVLTNMKKLNQIQAEKPIKIKHLTLNHLPKFRPHLRMSLLRDCMNTLQTLEVRAIRGETTMTLMLENLESLTLDQGIALSELVVQCQKLKTLRIQGCPKLKKLSLQIKKLSQIQIYQSTPLFALRTLVLHVSNITYLAHVLAYYCPKLEALEILGSKISAGQLQSLGRALPSLKVISLSSCNVNDQTVNQSFVVLEPSVLGRTTLLPLVIHILG
ncbi:hypothetical protein ACJMK2_042026 [Sinanodonta woodiana]|uniref:F-box domain-containing protein n=1 Tax=Sinanodonta woodiana TaxID=1069815 RepID=A0ABD3W9A0_SINWO